MNDGDKIFYTPHTITVSKEGYKTKTITVVMDKNITVVLERIEDEDNNKYLIISISAIVLIVVICSLFVLAKKTYRE